MNVEDGAKHSGKFAVDGKDIDGELIFSGDNTNLSLHHGDHFRPFKVKDRCVLGTLRDLTRVSLHQCLLPQVPASNWRHELGSYYTARITPHFVLIGGQHLKPTDKRLKSVHFVLKDAAVIFPDYNAFSTAIRVTPRKLRSLLKATEEVIEEKIPIGKYPEVAYFTGRQLIFEAETVLGKISASHMPTINSGSPRGVSISNRIGCEIKFANPASFEEAILKLQSILPFFAIIAGRGQEIESLKVQLKGKPKEYAFLDVYWCHPPRREGKDERSPDPSDLPIDGVRHPQAFSETLTRWLQRHDEWKEARSRFANSFAKENFFDLDRLIGSANMFDLLPESAVPEAVLLGEEMRVARDTSKKLFKALSDSPERASVLSALGRLGQASLKRKVRHRASIVMVAFEDKLPNLLEVLDLAIDARNHFVHGTSQNIDYVSHFFETVAFFTRTLEFVFFASDFLEIGWDVRLWKEHGTTLSHPFASFLYNYPFYLERMREVLPVGHKLNSPQ